MFPSYYSTFPQVGGESSAQSTDENTHPVICHPPTPMPPMPMPLTLSSGQRPLSLEVISRTDGANTQGTQLLRGLPVSDNAQTLLQNPCWWIYEPRTGAGDPVEETNRIRNRGAGWLRYVTSSIGSPHARHRVIWSESPFTTETIVWKEHASSLPIPEVSLVIGGESWWSRRTTERPGRGRTLRQAAIAEAKHLQVLGSHSLDPKCSGGSYTAIPGVRMDTGSQADCIPDLLGRDELIPGERVKKYRRYSYLGDLVHKGKVLNTRSWAVELVISNYDRNRPSAFESDTLERIIEEAKNPELDSSYIDLHRDRSEGKSTISRSWYLATDGGYFASDDPSLSGRPAPPYGTTKSAQPVLMLVMTVLPSREELAQGLVCPPEVDVVQFGAEMLKN